MKYQLTVKDTSTQEIMTKIVTSGQNSKLDIVSIFDTKDNLTEVTISVNFDSSKVETFENSLNEAVFDPDSNLLEWKKID